MAETIWIGVSTLWVSTFLYGIYIMLFYQCLCVFLSASRSRSDKSQAILLISAVVMFLLSTTSVVINLIQGATAYGSAKLSLDELKIAAAIVYVTNNVVGDALLIYRCWVIWNTVYITIVPLLLLVATMILGYAIQLKLFFILSLTTNLLIPALVAGRLWWILRRVRGTVAAAETRKKGRRAMVILLESGLIYSIIVSIHMMFFHYNNPMDEVVYAALAQVVGIVPTLIIVRVGRGISQDCQNGSTMINDNAMGSTLTRTATARSDMSAATIVIHPDPSLEKPRGSAGAERSRWEVDSPV